MRFALLQHWDVWSGAVAAAPSSIKMIAFASELVVDTGWVIMLKSSWSRANRGPLHLGMVLERGVPLDVLTPGEYMLRFVGLITPDIALILGE